MVGPAPYGTLTNFIAFLLQQTHDARNAKSVTSLNADHSTASLSPSNQFQQETLVLDNEVDMIDMSVMIEMIDNAALPGISGRNPTQHLEARLARRY